MTIQELINKLEAYKSNVNEEVLFSSDEEGNTLHVNANLELTTYKGKEFLVIYPLNSEGDIH